MTSISSEPGPKLLAGRSPAELLVPVALEPGYQPGLAVAADLARTWGLPVRLLHVAGGDRPEAVDFAALTRSYRVSHPDVVVATKEVDGGASDRDVADAIAAEKGDRSLIVLASERASQWLDEPSVAELVIGLADEAVVLSGPQCIDPPVGSSVVVGLDGSPRAETALEPAAAVALASEVKLWIVTAVSEAMIRTVAELRARGQEVSESAYIRGIAERLATEGVDVGWKLVHDDDPISGLDSFAATVGASMIVAASHGETGVARRLFGSVCMGLVERARVPILAVKAEVDESIPVTAGSS